MTNWHFAKQELHLQGFSCYQKATTYSYYSMTEATSNFLTPANCTDLCSFIGQPGGFQYRYHCTDPTAIMSPYLAQK